MVEILASDWLAQNEGLSCDSDVYNEHHDRATSTESATVARTVQI
jgi:hypothetical protein